MFRTINDYVSVVPKILWVVPLFFLHHIERFVSDLLPNTSFLIRWPIEFALLIGPTLILAAIFRLLGAGKNDEDDKV